MSILILDRDMTRREFLADAIRVLLEQDTAFDYMEQHDVFQQPPVRRPDAAFLWIGGMPDLEAARQLIRILPKLPVVLVSSSGEYAVESYYIGVCYYLAYPVDDAALSQALERCGLK